MRILLVCLVALACGAVEVQDLVLERHDGSLLALIARLADRCEAGYTVDAAVFDHLDDDCTLDAGTTWNALLDRLAADGLGLVIERDHLRLCTAQTVATHISLRIHDSAPLLAAQRQVIAESLELGRQLETVRPLQDSQEAVAEDQDEGALVDRLQNEWPDAWDREGVDIDVFGGHFLVRQTPEMQERIAERIASWQALRDRRLAVELWRLRQDPEGIALDDEAWASTGTMADLLGNLVLRDGQRGVHAVEVQTPVIVDLDVVGGAWDPILGVHGSGVMLEITPRAHGREIRAEVRLEVHEAEVADGPTLEAGGVTVGRLPAIDASHRRFVGTVLIPSGGAALCRIGSATWAIHARPLPASD